MTTGPDATARTVAVCAASYYADLVPAYAFVFRVPSTDTRFTVYATDADRYTIGATYTLTLAEATAAPVWLDADEWGFLRHCLSLVEHRWTEAIAEADAGAARPVRADEPAPPGFMNIEPTPAGYRAAGRAFRDELARVRRLRHRLDEQHADLDTQQGEEAP
jgi:hypothetical protein